jgi:glycosyltransferase involved in cell wall biosynthesis
MLQDRKKKHPVKSFGGLQLIVVSALCQESGSQLRARHLARSLENAGARVRFVPGIRSLPFGLNYFVSLITNFRLIFLPCKAIIGFKPLPNITVLMMIKKLLGKLTVIDIDDVDFGFRTGWISKLNRALQYPFPRRFSLVTYHSDCLRTFISETFGVQKEQLFQLPQGVDVELYASRDTMVIPKKLVAIYGLEGKKVVAYTGHLNIASDLDSIFQIIRIASEQFADLRFLVVGGGPKERYFRNLALTAGVGGITTFTGYLPPEDVVSHLRLADVGIVYYKENMANRYRESMKLREMLSMGLKVISNDFGDLKHFSSYTYQASSNYNAVAAELIRVLQDGGDGREVRGSEFVRDSLDWRKFGKSLYEKLTIMANLTRAEYSAHPR